MSADNLTDTQKIYLDGARQELEQAQQQLEQEKDLERMTQMAATIEWLKKKINFIYSPWYQEYQETNRRLESWTTNPNPSRREH